MAKRNVLVACNTLTAVQGDAYHSHSAFFYHLGKIRKYNFLQMFAKRMSIDRFRNHAARAALQLDAKYLMFIDDDMVFQDPHNVFEQLESAKLDICSALNYIRGYPFNVMGFKGITIDGKRKLIHLTQEDISKGGTIECEAIGTAVCLIKVDLFKKIPGPWFVTGPHNTEDIYFCCKAKDHLKKVKIGINTNVITGHLLEPEVISHHTRDAHMKFLESFMSAEEIESRNNKDRGQSYVQENIEKDLNA